MLNSVFGLMVMSVFAEIRNGLSVFANATFCFLDLSKEHNCSSILVFGNVRYKR